MLGYCRKMLQKMKLHIRRMLIDEDPFAIRSYAVEGEDMIVRNLLANKQEKGFYVDVGAHHPQRFSNTYYFYLRGWRGINIDPNPGCMQPFDQLRPRDINLELAVGSTEQSIAYHQFEEPALNGFSQELTDRRETILGDKSTNQLMIKTHRLEKILSEYLPENQAIDFLSVDVEGMDLEVLQSNDWNRFRPAVVLTEDVWISSGQADNSKVAAYMKSQGYELTCSTISTLIFTDPQQQVCRMTIGEKQAA